MSTVPEAVTKSANLIGAAVKLKWKPYLDLRQIRPLTLLVRQNF